MAEGNGSSGTYTEKDLEQFRLKFRKEALNACEEAERRGFKDGCSANLAEVKRAEDDARRWQSIAEAVGATQDELSETPKPASLVKYVMEQVYREMRTQFTDFNASAEGRSGVIATEDAVNLMKNVLLSTTESLMKAMPAVVVVGKRPARSSSLGDIGAPVSPQTSALRPSGVKLRPSNVLYPFLYPIRLSITADIESSRIVGGSGAFSSGHTSYNIRHSLRFNVASLSPKMSLSADALAAFSDEGMQEHRYKEFEQLNSALRKNYPDAVFPPIPPKEAAGTNSSAVQAATLSVLDRDAKDKSLGINEPRRRQLILWLKYICMHHSLQLSPDLLAFLCTPEVSRRLMRSLRETEELQVGDPAGRQRMQSTFTNTVLLSEMLNSSGSGDNFVYEGVGPVSAAELAGGKSASSFVGSHIKSNGIYNSAAAAALGKSSSPPAASADKAVVQNYTDIARNIAQRQLHTAIRDFDQLEPHLAAAIECSKYWYHALEAQADAWHGFVDSLPGLIAVEGCNFSNSGAASAFRIRAADDGKAAASVCRETQLWEVLYVTMRDSIMPSMESDHTVINTKFYEPHFYCGSLCLSQARASISNTKGIAPGTDEHVDASLKTAQEWGIFRRIRHNLLMEYEEEAVIALMFEVRICCLPLLFYAVSPFLM